MEKLRIGRIPYLNVFPFFYFLERLNEPSFEFIEAVPSELNRMLRTGDLDVSPSSSVEYLLNEGLYEIIEGHSISSKGPVKSILLFSKYQLKDLRDKTVLATYQSDTSVWQLKIIANRFLGLNIQIKKTDLPLYEGLKDYPAYLLIGDDAMRNAALNPELSIYDLGELWYSHTALPFVYALWIVRREAMDRKPFLIKKLKESLDLIKSRFLKDPSEIAHLPEIAGLLGAENVASYWRSLSFDLTDEHLRGMELFKKYILSS